MNSNWTLPESIEKDWISDCDKACESEAEFANFKRMRTIGYLTENRHGCHVHKEWEKAKQFYPGWIDLLPRLAWMDTLGNPLDDDKAIVDGFSISGGAASVAKISAQIRFLFGPGPFSIAEIGGGCGTLANALNLCGIVKDYTGFDLPSPSRLQKKYLERQGWKGEWPSIGGEEKGKYDLSISVASFSELTLEGRKHYMDRVLKKCDLGYHIWNWGEVEEGRDFFKETMSELLSELPTAVYLQDTKRSDLNPDDWVCVFIYGLP